MSSPPLPHTHTVPNISQLDERLVRLLAMQRVQQLFTTGERSRERENSPLSSRASTGLSNHTEAPPKHLNGLKPVLLPKPVKPFFSPGTQSPLHASGGVISQSYQKSFIHGLRVGSLTPALREQEMNYFKRSMVCPLFFCPLPGLTGRIILTRGA